MKVKRKEANNYHDLELCRFYSKCAILLSANTNKVITKSRTIMKYNTNGANNAYKR